MIYNTDTLQVLGTVLLVYCDTMYSTTSQKSTQITIDSKQCMLDLGIVRIRYTYQRYSLRPEVRGVGNQSKYVYGKSLPPIYITMAMQVLASCRVFSY